MEIGSDVGQHPDDDIEIDFDEDYVEDQPDQAMSDEQDDRDGLIDDEMNDENKYNDDVLNENDEELDDFIEDPAEEDVDVTDVIQDDVGYISPLVGQAENISTSETHNPNIDNSTAISSDETALTAAPYLTETPAAVVDDPENQLHEQIQSNTFDSHLANQEQDFRDHEQPVKARQEHGSASPGLDREEDQHELPESQVDRSYNSTALPKAALKSSVHLSPPHTPILAMSKDQLSAFPMTLHFAGTDNNLFPLESSDEPTPGYLLGDRALIKQPIKTLFNAFRERFGEAISEKSLLGVEFPELDLKLNEDSPLASEAGCCLLSFVDLYVKLSRNDGVPDPPPFSLNLNVEDQFYSRFQYLRNALNEGKGLSAVVQSVDFDEHFEGGHDEYVEGEEFTDLEHYDASYDHPGGEEIEEAYDGNYQDRLRDEQQQEREPHDVQELAYDVHEDDEALEQSFPSAGSQQDDTEAFEEDATAGPNEDEFIEGTGPVASEQVKRLSSDEQKEHSPNSGLTAERPGAETGPVTAILEGPNEGAASTNGSSMTSSQSNSPVNEDEFELIWDDDTNYDEDQDQPTSSSSLKVDESLRAHEDEESLIDYSDHEEVGDTNAARKSETRSARAPSTSPNTRKRKLDDLETVQTPNGNGPSKAPKTREISASPSVRRSQMQPTDDARNGEHNFSTQEIDVRTAASDPPGFGVEEEDLIIDYGADDRVLNPKADQAVEQPLRDVSTVREPGGNVTNARNYAQKSSIHPVAPTDEEDDLINYGSDFEQPGADGAEHVAEDSAAIGGPGTEPKPTVDDEEDLIDYSEDEDAEPGTVKAS